MRVESPSFTITEPNRVPILKLDYTHDSTALFQVFAGEQHAILFDSGKPWQHQGRYDILSAWPREQLQITTAGIEHTCGEVTRQLPDIHAVKALLSQRWQSAMSDLPFCGGWMGFASYELGYHLEPHSGQAHENPILPLFWAGYYDWAIIQDHQQQTCQLVYAEDMPAKRLQKIQQQLQNKTNRHDFSLAGAFTSSLSYQGYTEAFARIQGYLQAGDCYQVNFAQRYQAGFRGDAFTAFQALRQVVPSPYMVYLNHPQAPILSISPERFIQAKGQHVFTKPIKGTAPRQPSTEADAESAKALQHSSKNRAENLMIVDLLRNDFGRYCNPGSIRVEELFALESFSNVHHLVSSIRGDIAPPNTIWDLFFASLPGGSITGAPKIRACQIINELENFNREIYCGSLFYASNNGRFDSSIAIRTLLCHQGNIYAWAGGGIVKDSACDDEYQECTNKIGHLLQALEAHQG